MISTFGEVEIMIRLGNPPPLLSISVAPGDFQGSPVSKPLPRQVPSGTPAPALPCTAAPIPPRPYLHSKPVFDQFIRFWNGSSKTREEEKPALQNFDGDTGGVYFRAA